MTNSQKYLIMCQQALANAAAIQAQRVVKYANQEEPFANFISSAEFARTTVVRGILTRVGDKFGRLENVLQAFEAEQPLPVASDESLNDTFDDIINYVNILRVWILTKGGTEYPEGIPEQWADGALLFLDQENIQRLWGIALEKVAAQQQTLSEGGQIAVAAPDPLQREAVAESPVVESPAPPEENPFRALLKKVTGQGA